MAEIEVPIATTWVKFVVTPVLGLISIAAISWGTRKFVWCIQIIRGVSGLPPKAPPAGAFVGLAVHLFIIVVGVSAGYFLLGLLTTQPYIVMDEGLIVGARPPHYRQRLIHWNEIRRVDCLMHRHSSEISKLNIYSTQGREVLGNGAARLEPVREFLKAHLGEQGMSPCYLEGR